MNANLPSTIEMVTFKAKAGVTPEQLAATGPAMYDFLAEQPGFIYRSLSADEDGLWHDIVYWQSLPQAQAAGEKFMQHPSGKAMMALIDIESTRMRHMQACTESPCSNG